MESSILRLFLVLNLIIHFSCSPSINKENVLILHDLPLTLRFSDNEQIRLFRSELGIIDTVALPAQAVLDKLHPKVAKSEQNDEKITSLAFLDINGNGLLNDYNIDRIALIPNNWNSLNAEKFMRLDFLPLKAQQSFYLYDQFFTITDIHSDKIVLSPSQPTSDYLTFPYTLPVLIRSTINGETLDFRKLIDEKKLIYLEFWGTWCSPCVAQIPDIKELNNRFGDQICIVGISGNDELTKLKVFTSNNEMNWLNIQLDPEIERSIGKIRFFPLGVLFDQDGRLIRYGIKPKEIIEVLSKNR